ncbi:MAG: threonylcarbamoyl-AMP synthase [Saprospiraceae bacterium]|nr:threonylcarbamoyl-AMP synthase [Saprospiraceae bacterium]
MFLRIHPDNPQPRKIQQVINILKDGGVIIYPTDTIYGLGCDITNNKAVERICRIKGIKPQKANFSFICSDLSNISNYTKPFSNNIYKAMRRLLPGPYTFILNANNQVPKMLKNKKKTVGIRVPNTAIVQELVEQLGSPLMSTSIKNTDDDVIEYPTDPEDIWDEYKNLVDVVIDGGFGGNIPSTILDCTTGNPELIRAGLGDF